MCYSFHKKVVLATDTKAIACELSCGRWHCPDCGNARFKRWFEIFKNLSEMSCHFEIAVFTDKKARESFARKLRRHHCHHITVRIGNVYEIFHTPIYDNRQYKPDRSKRLTPKRMLAHAEMLLKRAMKVQEKVRITASQYIPRPSLFGRKPSEKWIPVAITPLSIEEIGRRMSRAGYPQVDICEVFPVNRLEAVVGEDFEISAVASKKFNRDFSLRHQRTSVDSEASLIDGKASPIGTSRAA